MNLADKSKLMRAALDKLSAVGLATYGRFGSDTARDNQTAIAYAEVASHLGCDFAYLPKAANALAAAGGDFPDARTVAEAMMDAEREATVTIGVTTPDSRTAMVRVPRLDCPVEEHKAIVAACARLGIAAPEAPRAPSGPLVPMSRLEAHIEDQRGLPGDPRGKTEGQPRDYGDTDAAKARQLAALEASA